MGRENRDVWERSGEKWGDGLVILCKRCQGWIWLVGIRYVEKYVGNFWGGGELGRVLLVGLGCGKLCEKIEGKFWRMSE